MSTVDLDQLTAALAGHDADPETVMTAFRRKRRRRARNRYLSLSAAAVAATLGLTIGLQPRTTAPQPTGLTTGGKAASGTALADGCARLPLRERLAAARSAGASVIVGYGSLTGKSAAGYDAMTLRSVRTLAGPTVASGSTSWVPAGSSRAPDGRLFAIVWPKSVAHATVGPILAVAPVVNGQVIFGISGCWDTASLPLATVEQLASGR